MTYQGTALAPIVTESSVVNILEFNVDIGDLLDIRAVNAIVTKSAQGVMVPVDAIAYEAGIPSVEVQSGEATYRVTVNILAADEDNAVVAPANASDTLIRDRGLSSHEYHRRKSATGARENGSGLRRGWT